MHVFLGLCLDLGWPAWAVPQQSDFGKDVFFDVGAPTQSGSSVLTGETFAAQIKGGTSYKRANGYAIPVGEHYSYWANSTVPVVGVVHDPDDGRLRWVNLTAHLIENGPVDYVPVEADAVLDDPVQLGAMLRSLRTTPRAGDALRAFGSIDEGEQTSAVFDCFAVGRHDARTLIGLRRIFLSLALTAQIQAVIALAHCTPHPDILWTKDNWIEPNVADAVRAQLRWSIAEVGSLIALLDDYGFVRGSVGQSIFHLLIEDPNLLVVLRELLIAGNAHQDVLEHAVLVQ